ncbi:MAG: YwiC-like family protein [Chitinivibrionia bacterium]|nr:YwiC-like family protein [Chitinivibrionia bacterium]
MVHQHSPGTKVRPPIPREHGAWGILCGAFLSAAARTGDITPGMLAFLAALVSFYFSRHAFLAAFGKRPVPGAKAWFAGFALAGLACLVGAAEIARFRPLLLWCMLWPPFFAAEWILIKAHRQQTLIAQIIGTAGLTLAAPLSYAVHSAGMVPDALFLWFLNMAFFTGLILFVRYQIARTGARAAQDGGRNPYMLALLLYNAVLAVAFSILAVVSSKNAGAGIVFLPSILQASAAAAGMLKIRTIRRLGWLQMAHTVVFVVLLGLSK